MTVPQVAGLHVGLLQFLLAEVNRISAGDQATGGVKAKVDDMKDKLS